MGRSPASRSRRRTDAGQRSTATTRGRARPRGSTTRRCKRSRRSRTSRRCCPIVATPMLAVLPETLPPAANARGGDTRPEFGSAVGDRPGARQPTSGERALGSPPRAGFADRGRAHRRLPPPHRRHQGRTRTRSIGTELTLGSPRSFNGIVGRRARAAMDTPRRSSASCRRKRVTASSSCRSKRRRPPVRGRSREIPSIPSATIRLRTRRCSSWPTDSIASPTCESRSTPSGTRRARRRA